MGSQYQHLTMTVLQNNNLEGLGDSTIDRIMNEFIENAVRNITPKQPIDMILSGNTKSAQSVIERELVEDNDIIDRFVDKMIYDVARNISKYDSSYKDPWHQSTIGSSKHTTPTFQENACPQTNLPDILSSVVTNENTSLSNGENVCDIPNPSLLAHHGVSAPCLHDTRGSSISLDLTSNSLSHLEEPTGTFKHETVKHDEPISKVSPAFGAGDVLDKSTQHTEIGNLRKCCGQHKIVPNGSNDFECYEHIGSDDNGNFESPGKRASDAQISLSESSDLFEESSFEILHGSGSNVSYHSFNTEQSTAESTPSLPASLSTSSEDNLDNVPYLTLNFFQENMVKLLFYCGL